MESLIEAFDDKDNDSVLEIGNGRFCTSSMHLCSRSELFNASSKFSIFSFNDPISCSLNLITTLLWSKSRFNRSFETLIASFSFLVSLHSFSFSVMSRSMLWNSLKRVFFAWSSSRCSWFDFSSLMLTSCRASCVFWSSDLSYSIFTSCSLLFASTTTSLEGLSSPYFFLIKVLRMFIYRVNGNSWIWKLRFEFLTQAMTTSVALIASIL